MAFPNYKKTWFSKKEDGWEDLGKVKGIPSVIDGKGITKTFIHEVCGTTASVGKENGEIFHFCSRCLIRI